MVRSGPLLLLTVRSLYHRKIVMIKCDCFWHRINKFRVSRGNRFPSFSRFSRFLVFVTVPCRFLILFLDFPSFWYFWKKCKNLSKLAKKGLNLHNFRRLHFCEGPHTCEQCLMLRCLETRLKYPFFPKSVPAAGVPPAESSASRHRNVSLRPFGPRFFLALRATSKKIRLRSGEKFPTSFSDSVHFS